MSLKGQLLIETNFQYQHIFGVKLMFNKTHNFNELNKFVITIVYFLNTNYEYALIYIIINNESFCNKKKKQSTLVNIKILAIVEKQCNLYATSLIIFTKNIVHSLFTRHEH